MSKKIALFIVMVMLVNMVVWAEEEMSDAEAIVILAIVGLGVVIGLIAWGISAAFSDAEIPNDGVRLTSLQNNELTDSKNDSSSLVNVFQHIQLGHVSVQ
jgi:endonuclease/exonuclease/phosphatase (EEP) superfamily protein YafD